METGCSGGLLPLESAYSNFHAHPAAVVHIARKHTAIQMAGRARPGRANGGMRLSDAMEKWLERRGVTVQEVADIVHELQRPYNDKLTTAECAESVRAVLGKREVQYVLYTGIALDELAERGLLPKPLQEMMEADESLYGVDETVALGIVHVYGMIGLTSFGYLDKVKPGVIGRLNGI